MTRFTAALLVAALAVSVAPAGEPEAVKALEAVGVKVQKGRDKKPSGTVELGGERVKDEHLKLLAEFKTLPMVVINAGTKVSADGLKQLADVKGLLRVKLYGKDFGDPHAQVLGTLKDLDGVYLWYGELTDDGVKELNKLTKLTYFDIYGSKKVAGKTLGELKGAKGLTGLRVTGTGVTGETLGELKALPALVSVEASSTPFSDAGMKELAKLSKLKSIELNRTAVTDAGLAEIQGLESLERLSIAESKVTDKSIPVLAGMKKLQHLTVGETQFAKLDELKKALPKVNVRAIQVPKE
jgi:internalin A